jgi:hypothetical protein
LVRANLPGFAGCPSSAHRRHIAQRRDFKPRSLQTNAMDERFNGRISDALATHRFKSGKDQAETLERYLLLYNQHLTQLALQHRTPIQAIKDWQKQRPIYSKSA